MTTDTRTGRAYQRKRKDASGASYTEATWTIVYDLERDASGKRKQKIESGFKDEAAARARLAAALTDQRRGVYLEPVATTLGAWLEEWIKTQTAIARVRSSTLTRYAGIVREIVKSELARLPLQKIRESHLERYYMTLSAGNRPLYHTVLRGALRKAWKEKLIGANPAADMDHAPQPSRRRVVNAPLCWTAAEARRFLEVCSSEDAQTHAFFRVLLDTGARKGEICALQWPDVDLDAATLRIERTLLKGGAAPSFGAPKNGRTRTVSLTPDTVAALRAHRRAQAELKLKNGPHYKDHGLVFAKAWNDARSRNDRIGEPLQFNTLGERVFDPLITKAGVTRITIHQIRHTVATLLLLAKHPPHIVADRLGHTDVNTTMRIYAHVLEDSRRALADTMASILAR